jgi:hypothetical protein
MVSPNRTMSSVFISHNHIDKLFARRLGADLSALGVRVWIDEAEIKIGESLITKISRAIDEMEYLVVVLSPNSVSSKWVQEEMRQAMEQEISGGKLKVLPILSQDCTIPGFLRHKFYADFREQEQYESSFQKLLDTLGVNKSVASGAALFDPFADRYERVKYIYTRPRSWFCIYCGCKHNGGNKCAECKTLRPFAGASTTMVQCPSCEQFSIAAALYCEWCGVKIDHDEIFIKWLADIL